MANWGSKKPLGYTCYVCGAQFGSRSLHIHLPQCAEGGTARQEQLPAAARRALPPPPAGLPADADGLPRRAEEIEAFNDDMFQAFQGASLTRCEGCRRSFKCACLVGGAVDADRR
jgi:hypothetical protein